MANIVILEWDGGKPPTTFYKRLHNLGLRVRGDKSVGPIERRQAYVDKEAAVSEYHQTYKNDFLVDIRSGNIRESLSNDSSAVIVQEGAIICASASLASVVAAIAMNCGAKNIMLGTTTIDKYVMTEEDAKILNYVESVYGRKGRPTADKVQQVWVVTCYEEGRSYPFYGKEIVTCPHCSGLKVAGRQGDPNFVRPIQQGENVFEYWVQSRFITGYFEKPGYKKGDNENILAAITRPTITLDEEKKVVDMIEQAYIKGFAIDGLKMSLSDMTHVDMFDAILSARAHLTKDQRKKERVNAIAKILTNPKVDASKIRFNESPNAVDLLDASAILAVHTWF
jgi:hypothetical protein